MEQELTIEEIESQFESEWVLLGDPRTSKNLKVLSGRVLFHSKDRDKVCLKALARRPKPSAVLFTGEPPEDVVLCW